MTAIGPHRNETRSEPALDDRLKPGRLAGETQRRKRTHGETLPLARHLPEARHAVKLERGMDAERHEELIGQFVESAIPRETAGLAYVDTRPLFGW